MYLRPCVVALFATVLLGCSSPPSREQHQAEGAIAAARAAGAATYAPSELDTAETALGKYDAAVGQRDYRLALSLALEARDTAYEAVKRAGDEKASARSQAEHLVAELEQLMRTASARLGGPAGQRPTGAAGDRVRAALKLAHTALQEARSSIEAQHYRDAPARLTPIIETLRAELAPDSGRRGR